MNYETTITSTGINVDARCSCGWRRGYAGPNRDQMAREAAIEHDALHATHGELVCPRCHEAARDHVDDKICFYCSDFDAELQNEWEQEQEDDDV